MPLQKKIESIEYANYEYAGIRREIVEKNNYKVPFVAIINTNPEDEPSARYIRNKMKKLSDWGIKSKVVYVTTDMELVKEINECNSDDEITSVIVQAPLGRGISLDIQDVFDMVLPKKDIDRLHSKWYYHKDENNLPLTALGMYKLIHELPSANKVLFIGNGITTNKRLYLKLFDEGMFDVRIVNSKTPRDSRDELISWADIIVSATGILGYLKCKDKVIISPSLISTENGLKNDLDDDYRMYNLSHNIRGGIGKLTLSELVARAYKDI